MNLETKYAPEIIQILEKEQENGSQYVVFEMRPMDMALQPHQLDFFKTLDGALDHLDAKAGYGYLPGGEENPVFYRPVEQLLQEIKQANPVTPDLMVTKLSEAEYAIKQGINQNNNTMNLNNLQDLQQEVRKLGFNPKIADELEKNMKPLPGYFTLKDQFPGDKGTVDMTLHFKKSGQSDNYSFNKFEVTAGKVPPTVENQHYMVISADKDKPDKFLVKNFDSPNEALDFFKKQKGTSELAVGESIDAKQNLASMKDGKVNFINPDFRQAYFSPAVSQTFYIKDDKSFSASQAANLVQDRTVLRNDLVTRDSQPYQAWIRLDFDQKKDDYGNHKFKQFHHPTYGFDLDKTLGNYKIKELSDPEKKAEIIKAMSNGDRVVVTATGKDGKEAKVMAEAVPRYGKLDFFSEKGAGLKREQFTKPAAVINTQSQSKSQSQDKTQQQSQSRGIR